jgi:hypothetical protein
MFLHALNVCCLNSWVAAKNRGTYKTQRDFLLDCIQALNRRAEFEDKKRTRRNAIEAFATPPKAPPGKQIRLGKHNLQLPQYRLAGDKVEHDAIVAQKQGFCVMCKYLYAVAKRDNVTPLPSVAKPNRKCLTVRCDDHLCLVHFDEFHR